MEGVPDRLEARIVHASGSRTVSGGFHGCVPRASGIAGEGEATGMPEVRLHASRREQQARRDESTENVPPTEANRTDVRQAISPAAQARKRMTHREPARRGCSYDDVRRQKSVRRIARRDARGAARQIGGATLAQGHSARRADARGGGTGVRTVRGVAQRIQPRRRSQLPWPGPTRSEGHDGRRPDRSRVVP